MSESKVEKETKVEFLNPLQAGVTYEAFIKEVEKSKKTVAEYCKGHLEKDTIEWIENEIKQIKE